VHTIDPVRWAATSARKAMALMLAMLGGAVLTSLGGCTYGVAHPFRTASGEGGSGGGDAGEIGADGGLPPPDAGPDQVFPCPPTKLVGYAVLDGGTFGAGADAATVTATTLAELRMYAGQVGPGIIRVSGTIEFPAQAMPVEVESDKTVVPGKIGDGLLGSGFIIKDKHNVIVRNLTIAKALAPYDAITIQSSVNVWVDHCDLSSELESPKGTYDGLVDIVHGSSNVTISWTRFHDHYNTSLVGHTDTVNSEDSGLAVTFHHNLFLRTPLGSPRARFGHVHLFNNHYDTVETYGIASVMDATLLIEGNVFDGVKEPIVTHLDGTDVDGTVADVRNLYDPTSTGPNVITTPPNTWKPPYNYLDAVDSTESVRVVVDSCAGVGKVP
jgi:pectate lyase